jgi:hypothetical protein
MSLTIFGRLKMILPRSDFNMINLKGLCSENYQRLKVISIKRSSFRIEPLIHLFLNFKGTCSLYSKKPPKYVAYPIQGGVCCK